MTYSLIYAEGSSDSALLTGAFQRVGFRPCRKLSVIPEAIHVHYPKTFPAKGDFLNRVNNYPEVLVRDGHYVAIINTGGLSNLGDALRNSILLMKDELPSSAIVFVDADSNTEAARFNEVASTIRRNFVDLANERLGVSGIELPDEIGEIKKGTIDTGVYIWPGAGATGTLEKVVLQGVLAEFPGIFDLIDEVPGRVRELYDVDHEVRRTLDSGFNLDKAKSTMMGGVLSPSASLSVYLSKESHKLNAFFSAPALTRLIKFLEKFFPLNAKPS